MSPLLKTSLLRRKFLLQGFGTLKQELADLLQPAAVNCFGQGAVENLAKHTPEVSLTAVQFGSNQRCAQEFVKPGAIDCLGRLSIGVSLMSPSAPVHRRPRDPPIPGRWLSVLP